MQSLYDTTERVIEHVPDLPVRLPTVQAVKAVFVDQGGTLVADLAPDDVDPAHLRFMPNALEGLHRLAGLGYAIVVLSHQPGVALNLYDRAALARQQRALTAMLVAEGVTALGIYSCIHAGADGPVRSCLCRKPAPGLLHQAARQHVIDLGASWMIGDRLDDVEAGQRARARGVLLDLGHETDWRLTPLRTPWLRATDLLDAARQIAEHEALPTRLPGPAAVAGMRTALPAPATGA